MSSNSLNSIKTWAEEDRPREKLLLKGKQALSDAELLAIIIGSGSANESAVDLCRRILRELAQDNLHELAQKSITDLMTFKGIGEAKAISIVAAVELGARRRLAEVRQRVQIGSSNDAFDEFQPLMGDLPHEEFWVMYLSRANKVLSKERISSGGVSGTVADVRMIFKRAISLLASGIILCHNHPSGNLQPSKADENLTQQFKEAGKILDVRVLDHLILGESPCDYYSFADSGKL